MIYNALNCLEQTLNQFFKNSFGLQESKVSIGKLINQDGSIPEGNINRLMLTLVNIAMDSPKQFASPKSNTGTPSVQAPVYYNLSILLSSNFTDYSASLKFLSSAISFFKAHPLFDHRNNPALHQSIVKLTVEFSPMNLQEMQTLWVGLGTKYIPSILLKVRMITDEEDMTSGFDNDITGTTNVVNP